MECQIAKYDMRYAKLDLAEHIVTKVSYLLKIWPLIF